jgi:hypothetical protein
LNETVEGRVTLAKAGGGCDTLVKAVIHWRRLGEAVILWRKLGEAVIHGRRLGEAVTPKSPFINTLFILSSSFSVYHSLL